MQFRLMVEIMHSYSQVYCFCPLKNQSNAHPFKKKRFYTFINRLQIIIFTLKSIDYWLVVVNCIMRVILYVMDVLFYIKKKGKYIHDQDTWEWTTEISILFVSICTDLIVKKRYTVDILVKISLTPLNYYLNETKMHLNYEKQREKLRVKSHKQILLFFAQIS